MSQSKASAVVTKPKNVIPWTQAMQKIHACAISFDSIVERTQNALTHEKITKDKVLLCSCVCRDEINEKGMVAFKRVWGMPFDFNGLGGWPAAGLTGFGAMSHHVPKDGCILIVFGPHVGLWPHQGENIYGKVMRLGMTDLTTSCGAVCGFLQKIKNQPGYCGVHDPHDIEMKQLESALLRSPIHPVAEDALFSTNEQLHRLIYDELKELIKRSETKCPVVLIGGIILNVPGKDDYMDVKTAEIVNYNNERGRVLDISNYYPFGEES